MFWFDAMYVRSHIKVILKETLLINVQLFLVYIISKYRILQKKSGQRIRDQQGVDGDLFNLKEAFKTFGESIKYKARDNNQ